MLCTRLTVKASSVIYCFWFLCLSILISTVPKNNMLRYILFILTCITCGLFSTVTSQTIVDLPPTISLTKGDNATLECVLLNLGGAATFVFWYHDNNAVSYNQDLTIHDTRYNLLTGSGLWRITIQMVTIKDEGIWRCSAEIGTQGLRLETSTLLFVKTSPEIFNKTVQSVLTPRLGSSFELFCNATGSPKPTITWIRDFGNIILTDKTQTEFVMGPILRFSNVTEKHHGTYTCHATNGLRNAAKSSFNVQIAYAPVVMTHSRVVTAAQNISTKISCTVRSYPHITSVSDVRWTRNGVNVVNDQNHYSYNLDVKLNDIERSRSVLSLPGVDSRVTGEYVCQFTNSRGMGSATITLRAGPSSLPSTGAVRSSASSQIASCLVLLIAAIVGYLIGQE